MSACLSSHAAEFDASKLPPPATNTVDFTRDVRPILESSCLRCHGPEKPKSGFRLDNRASALKGGEQGVDILPGQSAQSPLIHYVCRLVPDMEMPPSGKGDQLAVAQVSLLRAWIDQGAVWDAVPPAKELAFSLSPTFGWTFVKGDEHKFRELYWQKEGPNGGLERFELFEQTDPDTKVFVTGHALLDDYKISLEADRHDLGFVHTGWEQYRKYFDDTGGYNPTAATPFAPSLGRDLHLEIGKAWIDFGLTLPDWPRMVLGYEYDYKRGDEATTGWGAFGPAASVHNIAPVAKQLDEGVHIIKFAHDTELRGVAVEDRFRGEFYRLDSHYTNLASRGPVSQDVREGDGYFQGANTLRLERKFNDWLFGSAGYLYSRMNADSSFMDVAGLANATFAASVPKVVLEKESHVFNLNTLVGPFAGLTFSAGAQGEQTHQDGLGSGTLNQIFFTASTPATLAINPADLVSDYNQRSISESAALRYTKIPFTVLFAEARSQQQKITSSEADLQPGTSYQESPDFSSYLYDVRGGFSTSPWQSVSFSTHYRRHDDDSRYGNSQLAQPPGGYPGFILRRDLLTDEVETKLTLRPCPWLRTSWSWQLQKTDYWEGHQSRFRRRFPGGVSPVGRVPIESLHRQRDADADPAAFYLAQRHVFLPAHGHADRQRRLAGHRALSGQHLLGHERWHFCPQPGHGFVRRLFLFQGGLRPGQFYGGPARRHQLPAARAFQAGFTRRFNTRISARLQYAWYHYLEPSSGAANNFTANAVFLTITCRFL